MKYEKITKIGIGRTYQRSLHFTKERTARFSDSKSLGGIVWRIENTGVPIYSAGKSEQRTYCYTGKFCCIYCQTATRSDQASQKFCKFQRNVHQQSGQNCAGRFSSKKGPWPKNKGGLKYPIAMTGCGSKSSHRFTIFLSLATITTISPIIFLNH